MKRKAKEKAKPNEDTERKRKGIAPEMARMTIPHHEIKTNEVLICTRQLKHTWITER